MNIILVSEAKYYQKDYSNTSGAIEIVNIQVNLAILAIVEALWLTGAVVLNPKIPQGSLAVEYLYHPPVLNLIIQDRDSMQLLSMSLVVVREELDFSAWNSERILTITGNS